MECVICCETGEASVATPCGHHYHKSCISNITRPRCPLCQADITEFLVNECGVDKETLTERQAQDDDRILHQSLHSCPVEELSVQEALFMVRMEIRNNFEDWFFVFRDILLDRIFDARQYFLRISQDRGGRGLFTFWFDEEEILDLVSDPKHRSAAVWMTPSKMKRDNPDLGEIAQSVVGRVKDAVKTDFGVLIGVVTNEELKVATRVLSVDESRIQTFISNSIGGGYVSGVRPMRVSYRDLICSLTKGNTCRRNGHSPTEHNPEYVWARKVWKRIERRANYI